MAGPVTVLSIDGGGVRGLIPALVLQNLMRRVALLVQMRRHPLFPQRTARIRRHAVVHNGEVVATLPVRACFDLMAGTSTGALLVLGCALPQPYTPAALVNLYRNHVDEIFPPARFSALRAVRQAFAEKYDPEPYERLLSSFLGHARLHECPANLLIPAYDTDNRRPFFFKRRYGSTQHGEPARGEKRDFYLRDVARATSAAPTFFPPAHITALDGHRFSLIDGAMVANNPTLSAVVEARKLYPHASRLVVVSLGTGRSGRRYPYEKMKSWGYLDWVSPFEGVPLITIMMDGQGEATAYHLTNMPGIDYFRFNVELNDAPEGMDDASSENMAIVAAMARQLIRTRSADLHRLAVILARRLA